MYEGYLIKIGDKKLPMDKIAARSYRAKPHQRLELDAYRDNLGELQREVARNRPTTISFNLEEGINNAELASFMDVFISSYINEAERKVLVTYYISETDSYSDPEYMYLSDPEYPIDYIEDGVIYYDTVSLKLTGY